MFNKNGAYFISTVASMAQKVSHYRAGIWGGGGGGGRGGL